MKKRILSKLLCFCMALTLLLPAVAPTVRADGTVHQVGDGLGLYQLLGNGGLQSGDTIQLTQNINISNNFVGPFDGKNVTFDLNGHTLHIGGIGIGNGGMISIVNTDAADGGEMTVNSYLDVSGGSVVASADGGVLNVSGAQVTVTGSGSSATVNDVSNNSYAVTADAGGKATVNGNVTVTTSNYSVYGVCAKGSGGSSVTVNGNIVISGNGCYGVYVSSAGTGTSVTINGSVTASGGSNIGSNAGVSVVNSTGTTVSVTGDVSADIKGIDINSGSSNTVTVGGSVTAASNGVWGASIGFGSSNSIMVGGNVTVKNETANGVTYGAMITANSAGSSIKVDGGISATGSGTYTYGASISGGGTITVGKDVHSGNYGVDIEGGGEVDVNGSVSASGTGAYIANGGTAKVTGDITVNAASGNSAYSIGIYNYNCPNSTAAVTVHGSISASAASSGQAYGVNISNYSSSNSEADVTVDGAASALSTDNNATGVQIYNDTSGATADVTIGGDIRATGASSSAATAINAGGSNWTVTADCLSASGGASNTGVVASGSGTATVDAINASSYITIYNAYPSTTYNPGGGTLNSSTGYFDYLNGSTAIHVKGWTLTVDHSTGGIAGIGGTTVTSGKYEAGTQVGLVADDAALYDFDEWTTAGDDSFADANDDTTAFTMPAEDVTVTANFATAPTYQVDTSGIGSDGGTVTASPSLAEKGDTITLTISPATGMQLKAETLKYNDGTEDHTLNGPGSTPPFTFVMPEHDVTVSAEFEVITAPTITTTELPHGTETVSYSQTLGQSSNASAAWSLEAGSSLPDGLDLSQGGVISGMPTVSGTFTFTVKTENAGGSDTQPLTLIIAPAEPVITTSALPYAIENEPYSFQLEATGAPQIYWFLDSSPDWLYLDGDGTIHGTPMVDNDKDTEYDFEVTAYNFPDGGYAYATEDFKLTVHPAAKHTLTLTAGTGGSITTGGSGNYKAGKQISISAEPNAGHVFSQWTSSDGGSFDDPYSASATLTMPDKDTTVTANFVTGYAVSIDSAMTGGSITASTELAAEGKTVTLTVTPDLGKQLQADSLKYNDGTDHLPNVSGNTATFTMPASDVTVSAVFEDKPAIEVGSAADLKTALYTFKDGDTIKLKDNIIYTDPIVIDAKTVTFDTNGHILDVQVDSANALEIYNGGNLYLNNGSGGELNAKTTGGGYYSTVYTENGSIAEVTNVSTEGYGNYAVYAYGGKVTVNGNVSAQGDYTYAVYAEGGNVAVNGDVAAEGDYSTGIGAYNSTVTVEKSVAAATPILLWDGNWSGIYFSLGDGTLNNGTGYFEYVTGDKSATALVKGWNLTLAADTGGSITEGASGKYIAGTSLEISATASDGYTFGGWTSTNGISFANATDTSTTFTMPAAATTVRAAFTAMTTVTGVTVTPSAISVQQGNTKAFTATVSGTNNPDQTVNWSVTGNTTSGTAIDGSGLLTVAADEAATSLIVTATSAVDSNKSGTATVTVTTATAISYTITAKAGGGGSIDPGTVSVTSGSSLTFTITPDSGYHISSVTVDNVDKGAITTYTFTNITTNHTINATFTRTQTSPPLQTPDWKASFKLGDGTEKNLSITVDKDAGTASIDAGSQKLTSSGTVITAPTIPGVSTYSVGISVPELSSSGGQGTLTLNTDKGSVTIPSNMLSGASGIGGSKAEISIGQGDKSNLPDNVKAAIGDRPLIQLSLSVDGKQTKWSNPDAPVTVSIPYTPTEAELANPESIVIWYIDGSGNVVNIPNGHYDPATGKVTVDVTHFSNYAVVYNPVNFNDVAAGAWCDKAVSFIAARGITGGTGGGNFSPGAKLTRGDFMVMLMKSYGIAPDTGMSDNFSDAGSTYYTGYLAAAKRLGITAGVGNNEYAPEKEITRQEMFTLLYNALKTIGQLPQGDSGKTLSDFTDASQIDSWAKDAMMLLVKTGTVSGNVGRLAPTDKTTRAEMAQVLYSLLSK